MGPLRVPGEGDDAGLQGRGLVRPLPELWRLRAVLTVVPQHVPDEKALLMTVEHVRSLWPGWDRFLIGWCAAFHLAMSLPLAFAPIEQIVNEGTRPVFDLASRYVWASIFLAAGLLTALVLHWQTALVLHLVTWLTVFGVGGAWLTAFALAVLNDRGSAIGVTVWPFLYGPWAVAAFRLALGKR